MLKWFGGIAASLIVGLLIWFLTHAGGPLNPITPTPTTPITTQSPLSFLQKVAGSYVLTSWIEANRPIALGAKITEGTLKFDSNGVGDWSVLLVQTYSTDPGKVRMTARGQIQLDSQPPYLIGVQGSQFNNTSYLDSKWGQVSADVTLAVRGWNYGSPEDRFTISIDTPSGGQQLLQMKNTRGVFTWKKTQ